MAHNNAYLVLSNKKIQTVTGKMISSSGQFEQKEDEHFRSWERCLSIDTYVKLLDFFFHAFDKA